MAQEKTMAEGGRKKKESMFRITLRRLFKNKLATAGMIVFLLFLLVSIFAPWIAPYDYTEQNLYNTLAGPSAEHWCGTDEVGRDILSRLIYGGRYSLRIGLLSVVLAAGIGIPLGSMAGFMMTRDGQCVVGTELNATHHRPVSEGKVRGVCQPLHLGRQNQSWEIVVFDEQGRRCCTCRLGTAVLG